MSITGIHHLALTVADLDTSAAWYQELFGLRQLRDESTEYGRSLVFVPPES
jgi:catechol 2,3-dioxygenase-like lactoylglutathione lyase family enzyme